METQKTNLTKEQKREQRLQRWVSPQGITFRDLKAEKLYQERVRRFIKAFLCEEPDRVPVMVPAGNFPIRYAGHNLKKLMYDHTLIRPTWAKFINEFYDDMDDFLGPAGINSGRALELLDYKLFKWPGHGLADDVEYQQYVETILLREEEYSALLKDPSDFGFRTLMPRAIGSLDALKSFPALNSLMGMPLAFAYPFTRQEVRTAFQKLIEAGAELEKFQEQLFLVNRDAVSAGFPMGMGGVALAPFDLIADHLRGTQGSAIDMYRHPETLLEATDMILEQMIPRTISSVNAMGVFTVNFPLHKGDDTFMSNKQFEKFYWPSLKKLILALINEGIMVSLFCEGRYNNRLEYIGDFPKGWVVWQFDQTDMAQAKRRLGKNCCVVGNVPASLLAFGDVKDVKACCRKLIEDCASGGGYVLTGGTAVTEAKPENLRAFMQVAREYGVYH
ncbi:MAG: uroporphyrinogen decarboxylase family protein [Dehalococcoidales bacterium]